MVAFKAKITTPKVRIIYTRIHKYMRTLLKYTPPSMTTKKVRMFRVKNTQELI